ncbi:MAG: tRNA guanosine(34) transglycosylase Tgt [Planctomycetota bacterium]
MSLAFAVTAQSSVCGARCGVVETAHGSFETPAFMPVGTKGTVKGIVPQLVAQTGAQIVLNNTYHLLLRPGPERVAALGGVHKFMGWGGPILTDSGGYQAYSMADINAIDDEGVTFKSIVTGSNIRLTPEFVIEVQQQLGADIIMAFDDCPPSVDPDAAPVNQTRIRQAAMRDSLKRKGYDHEARLDLALARTTAWLQRCIKAHGPRGIGVGSAGPQSLFGIVQGGTDLDRRSRSVEQVCNIECPGYAIGGVAVGEQADDIARVVRHTAPLMPADKPRYLMGVGYEHDLVAAVCAGIDMFDCVLPTRNGRNANAFVRLDEGPDRERGRGQIRLRNSRYTDDPRPIEEDCDCPACSGSGAAWLVPEGGGGFSRAYLRHLFLADEMLGPILVSLHNLRYFQRLMLDLRTTIANDDWLGFARRWPRAARGLPSGVAALTRTP